MFNKLPLMLVALCTLGLVACGPGTATDPQLDNITLQLNRMEDGDLQFCDEATGECQELPYAGECVIVEVDIDPDTGATCERCITETGEVIDLGCTDNSVGCVLVTLPDPDCVVCAYVNGAIIFSSCVADDEPECYVDADCVSDNGMRGFCYEGQCVYEEGCLDDSQCPPGFQCVFPPTMDPSTGNAPGLVPGTCVPREIPCLSDDECPADMMCEVWCYGTTDPTNCDSDDPNCLPPEQCQGICVDRPFDPCADVVCPDGQHCELACWDGLAEPGEAPSDQPPRPCAEGDPNCGGWGGCEPVCVPDPTRCLSDDDCAEGEICEMWCIEPAWDCDPAAGEDCAMPPCEGICVPHIPHPCDNIECAPNQHCELECILDIACGPNEPYCGCVPVCVDDPVRCLSDDDCGEGEMCELSCWDVPVDCTDPSGADCVMPPYCEGICVPAVVYCWSNEDCPAGQVCELYNDVVPPCEDGSTNCDPGLWAPGICVDNTVECVTDEDCLDGDVWNARCVEGRCEYVEQFCMADSDCPPGFACALVDCDDASGTDCGPGFPGICVPVEPPPPPQCTRDEDCVTAAGIIGVCIDGVCVNEQPTDCFRTGCSGEICADEHIDSTCEYRPEYACFELSRCERQADGMCGWTETEEFLMCLADPDITNP